MATSSINASGFTQMLVNVKDPSGNGLSSQLVQVEDGGNLLTFPEGNIALTDSAGVARLKVGRSSLVAVGANTLTVNYTYKAGPSKPPRTRDRLIRIATPGSG